MILRPLPWRADSLRALENDYFPTTHVVVLVLIVVAVMIYAGIALIGGTRHDCDGTCLACEQERARGRRGL